MDGYIMYVVALAQLPLLKLWRAVVTSW